MHGAWCNVAPVLLLAPCEGRMLRSSSVTVPVAVEVCSKLAVLRLSQVNMGRKALTGLDNLYVLNLGMEEFIHAIRCLGIMPSRQS